MHAFVKVYEHERNDKSSNTAALMREFLPILQSAMSTLVNDKSEESRILQVLILKIFYTYTYCHFPLDVMSKEVICVNAYRALRLLVHGMTYFVLC